MQLTHAVLLAAVLLLFGGDVLRSFADGHRSTTDAASYELYEEIMEDEAAPTRQASFRHVVDAIDKGRSDHHKVHIAYCSG
jgi:hypothetical protein